MAKIKFVESNIEFSVKLKYVNNRVVCEFESVEDADSSPISEGFIEINEHNDVVQGDFSEYKYIYKKESDTIFILTCDEDDVYVEPEISDEETIDTSTNTSTYEPTEEELAEIERNNKIMNINSQIFSLKEQLDSTDYIFIKCYEASLVGEEINEYDLESIHNTRQSLREQINSLEAELQNL